MRTATNPFVLAAALLAVACLLSACASPSDTPAEPTPPVVSPEALEAAVDTAVREKMESEGLAGVAVVLVKDGETILAKGYGHGDVDAVKPIDPDETLFRIGSISKPLTALAVMRLVEDGRLSLDDDVAEYFDGFDAIPDQTSGAPITIRHLLTHTAGFDQIGIGRHIWDMEKTLEERLAERASLEEFLRADNLRRTMEPGDHFRYDTYGITLAGLVIEKVTGLPFPAAMRELLFAPAGMENSYVGFEPESLGRRARPLAWVGEEWGTAPFEVFVTQPASSVDMTPADMGRLLEALMGDGETAAGRRVFSPEMTAQILGPQYRPHPEFPGVTHGFREYPAQSGVGGLTLRTVGHGGSMLGFQSSLMMVPELGLAVFVVTNRNGEILGGPVSVNGAVNDAVLPLFSSKSLEPRFDVPEPDPNRDLSAFEGRYVYNVFCATCTPEEFARGGWPPGDPMVAKADGGALMLGDIRLIPGDEDGVFYREDGTRKAYFKRNSDQQVTSFSWSSGPDAFQRLRD